MTIDLVTASFDILSNAVYRNEPSSVIFNFKSFLVNKIPALFALLSSSMFPPLTPEFCITQALSRVDTNAFPSFSQAFEIGGSNVLSDVRQDFLFACALHGLVPVERIPQLLGEPPMSGLPEAGRYVKEELVAQCSTNIERVEELLNDLEGPDGNAVGIVGAVTEVNIKSTKRKAYNLLIISDHSEFVLSQRDDVLKDNMQFTLSAPTSFGHHASIYPTCEHTSADLRIA